MSEHNHAEYVDGCFRCDLSGDEVEPELSPVVPASRVMGGDSGV